jgi:hypothetical protein
MKKAFAIIMLLTVLLLSACNSTEVPQNFYGGTELQQTEASTTAADDETMTPENVTEAANNSFFQLVTETSKPATSSTEETVKKTEEPPSSASNETVASTGKEANLVTEQQKPPETTTATKPIEETKPTEPAETTPPKQDEKVEEKPETTEPPKQITKEPTQPAETEPEPEFDINYWIEYAMNYAVSKGLVLSSAAVDCWDNPIGAGAHCIYLERDIQSRLNRYANDEDITDVWIWAEPTGNGRYDLYIGYA